MAEAMAYGSIEDTIRQVVREEVRAALEEHIPRHALNEPKSAPSTLLTVEQVAERCHATPKTVRGWIRDRHLPARKAGGRRYLVDLADLERFLVAGSAADPLPTVAAEVSRIGSGIGLRVTSGN
jgi:excisionase family DNA binding protein